MSTYEFDHIHLATPDPAKTAQFYEKMFGAKMVRSHQLSDGRTNVELEMKGTKLLVTSPKAGKPLVYGIDHFGLKTDNIEAAVADLKKKGAVMAEEIRAVHGLKIAFMRAADNVLIEILQEVPV